MRIYELKCYGIILFLIILILSGVYILYSIKQTNSHKTHENNFVFLNKINQKEKTNHEKLVDDFHKRTKKEVNIDPEKSTEFCGIGWKYKNNTVHHGCVRDFKWPNVVDHTLQDPSINQCRDFFEFSCGRFNGDRYNNGKDSTFNYIHEAAAKTMRDITNEIVLTVPPDQSKISAFHHACMRHNLENNLQLSPTLQHLLSVTDQGVTKYSDLPFLWGKLQLFDTILPLELSFELNPFDATQMIPMLKQSGLFDEPDLINTEEHLADVSKRLELVYPLKALASEWANKIVSIERDLKSIFQENKALNLVEYLNQYNGREDIIDNWVEYFSQSRFNITAFIEAANPSIQGKTPWMELLKARKLWCYRPFYIDKLYDVIKKHSVSTWIVYTKHAILFHLDNGDEALQIDPETQYAYHKQYDYRFSLPWKKPRKFLSRRTESFTNETQFQTCVGLTESYLPIVLDNYYVNSYLSEELRSRAFSIATKIKATYVKAITEGSFFSYLSKRDRLSFANKVDSVRIQVGIPNVWPIDRSDLFVDPESYIESVLSIRKYHVEKNYRFFVNHAGYNMEVNGDNLFDGLVSNANAYYQHQLNTVTLTAGLLQPPIFSVLFDKVSLYSRFGVMFAHELSHSIDTIGVLFDIKGTYNPWMTSEGNALYQQKLDCFVESYSTTTNHGNMHNGRQTLNENIADNCALKIAYETFFEDVLMTTRNPPTIEQQRNFFVSYAQIYCESISKSQEQFLISHRSHAVNSLRVNNVVNQVSNFESIWGCNRHDHSFSFKNKCSIF